MIVFSKYKNDNKVIFIFLNFDILHLLNLYV